MYKRQTLYYLNSYIPGTSHTSNNCTPYVTEEILQHYSSNHNVVTFDSIGLRSLLATRIYRAFDSENSAFRLLINLHIHLNCCYYYTAASTMRKTGMFHGTETTQPFALGPSRNIVREPAIWRACTLHPLSATQPSPIGDVPGIFRCN